MPKVTNLNARVNKTNETLTCAGVQSLCILRNCKVAILVRIVIIWVVPYNVWQKCLGN